MALSIPLDLILEGEGWRCPRPFDILSARTFGQTGGGVATSVKVGNSLWGAQFAVGPLRPDDMDRISAKVQFLYDTMQPFLGWEPPRDKPIHYYADGLALPADVVGRLTTVTDNNIVTIDQVTAGLVIKAGDYCRVNSNGNRYYLRFVEDATADGSGVLNTVQVTPHLPASVEANAVTRFSKPQCLMVIVPGSLSMQRSPMSRVGSISFDAIQVLAEPA